MARRKVGKPGKHNNRRRGRDTLVHDVHVLAPQPPPIIPDAETAAAQAEARRRPELVTATGRPVANAEAARAEVLFAEDWMKRNVDQGGASYTASRNVRSVVPERGAMAAMRAKGRKGPAPKRIKAIGDLWEGEAVRRGAESRAGRGEWLVDERILQGAQPMTGVPVARLEMPIAAPYVPVELGRTALPGHALSYRPDPQARAEAEAKATAEAEKVVARMKSEAKIADDVLRRRDRARAAIRKGEVEMEHPAEGQGEEDEDAFVKVRQKDVVSRVGHAETAPDPRRKTLSDQRRERRQKKHKAEVAKARERKARRKDEANVHELLRQVKAEEAERLAARAQRNKAPRKRRRVGVSFVPTPQTAPQPVVEAGDVSESVRAVTAKVDHLESVMSDLVVRGIAVPRQGRRRTLRFAPVEITRPNKSLHLDDILQ